MPYVRWPVVDILTEKLTGWYYEHLIVSGNCVGNRIQDHRMDTLNLRCGRDRDRHSSTLTKVLAYALVLSSR